MKRITRFFGGYYIHTLLTASVLILVVLPSTAQEHIRLLVRGDDMGVSRSINAAAIAAYEHGIVRSVEVMVPGAWFEDAVSLLNERPDLDVGIHLTLTSEWSNVKWRPLTHCPSITDADGYFLPFVWQNQQLSEEGSIIQSHWDIGEIERELRAQIELALRKIPHVSHLSEHMGCLGFAEETKQLAEKLAREYGLAIHAADVKPFPRWSGNEVTAEQKIGNLKREIGRMPAGTYLLVEHPAFDDLETQGMGHVGYENVAEDRYGVYQALTDRSVVEQINQRAIQLISYRDLASDDGKK